MSHPGGSGARSGGLRAVSNAVGVAMTLARYGAYAALAVFGVAVAVGHYAGRPWWTGSGG